MAGIPGVTVGAVWFVFAMLASAAKIADVSCAGAAAGWVRGCWFKGMKSGAGEPSGVVESVSMGEMHQNSSATSTCEDTNELPREELTFGEWRR
jgi:hypothetical protein